MKQGWKATCLIPDYVFDENGDIQINSDKNRRLVKVVKFKDDGIHIEKALKSKTLRVPWIKIIAINQSKEVRDGMEIHLHDGKYVTFSIYNSCFSRSNHLSKRNPEVLEKSRTSRIAIP